MRIVDSEILTNRPTRLINRVSLECTPDEAKELESAVNRVRKIEKMVSKYLGSHGADFTEFDFEITNDKVYVIVNEGCYG